MTWKTENERKHKKQTHERNNNETQHDFDIKSIFSKTSYPNF